MSVHKTLGFVLVLSTLVFAEHSFAQKKEPLPITGYTENRAKTCVECHRSDPVKEIFDTLHADSKKPGTPFRKEECESCHGPSAAHANFPLQIKVFQFGKQSSKTRIEQNQVCLECHAKDERRKDWKDGMHNQAKLACVNCHSIHKARDPLLNHSLTATVCTQCHEEKRSEQHIVGLHVIESGKVSCTDCHNPHSKLDTALCVDCHEQDPETIAKQSAKAREFHAAMQENNLPCLKCHRGVAHGVPSWVEELADKQKSRRPQ